MALKQLLLILCVTETLQHLSYPINFCNMASTCIHDGRTVCASSPDGCSRKSFIDQCDMYEYNCDYGTRYQETYILFCGTLNIPTQLTEIQPSMTKTITSTGTNESKLNLTTMLLINVTSRTDVDGSDTEIKPNTLPSTKLTSTIVASIENDNHDMANQSTPAHSTTTTTTTIKNNSKEDVINKNDDNKRVTHTTPVYCCNRPLTWETTTQVTKIFEDISIENNISEQEVPENSIEYNITENLNNRTLDLYENVNHTTLTTIHQISDTVKLKGDTDIFHNTETDEILVKTETNIKKAKQTTPYCCNRPLTWETTTELTNILEDITIENTNSQENNIDNSRETDKNNKEPIQTMTHTSDNTASYTTSSKYSKTTATTNLKLRLTTPTKYRKFSTSNNCNNKCQRPLIWLTTLMRRRG